MCYASRIWYWSFGEMGRRLYILSRLLSCMDDYNRRQKKWAERIRQQGGQRQTNSRIWFAGGHYPDAQSRNTTMTAPTLSPPSSLLYSMNTRSHTLSMTLTPSLNLLAFLGPSPKRLFVYLFLSNLFVLVIFRITSHSVHSPSISDSTGYRQTNSGTY